MRREAALRKNTVATHRMHISTLLQQPKEKNLEHSSSLNCKDLGERKTVAYEEVVVEEVDKE